ncbi:MAG TPA: hypothetical protein VH394_05330 [Thermoanaerobaculia bacterium]|jgi:hypothetical protein|nr:hypothetical protein [Thermoanaerobaculia bacterium]
MDTKPTKPGPWYADETQDPPPTSGSTDNKSGTSREGEVRPASAGADEDQPVVDPGPKSDREGDVKPPGAR